MAVRDGLIRVNPSDGVMAEIKKSHVWKKEKRRSLTVPQRVAFMRHLNENNDFVGWRPVITVLLGTGMRIGDFFILPSSIHEILIVPDNGKMDLKELEAVVLSILILRLEGHSFILL